MKRYWVKIIGLSALNLVEVITQDHFRLHEYNEMGRWIGNVIHSMDSNLSLHYDVQITIEEA